MLLVGRGVEPGPALDHRLEIAVIVEVVAEHVEAQEILVAEHRALAGVGQDDELVA